MRYPNGKILQATGYDYVINKLVACTPYGRELKKNIRPFRPSEKNDLDNELMNIGRILEAYKKNRETVGIITTIMSSLKDIKRSASMAGAEYILDEVELFEIKVFSMSMEELAKEYKKLDVIVEGVGFESLMGVIKLLDPNETKIPTFYLYESYSAKLESIRKEKRNIELKISSLKDLQQIEQLKKIRAELVFEESEEEGRIRKRLSIEISGYSVRLLDNIRSLARLDLLIAKAKLADIYGCVKPELTDINNIRFKGLYNPEVLDMLKEKGRKYIPVDIDLKNGTSVITGINMGGKSLSLKTVVLNLLLGSMGFFVFCSEAHFPLLDFIILIAEDNQSQKDGLSTFGAEIAGIREALRHVKNEKGFLAIDEFARGTNPAEGSSLVKALCSYLSEFDSISLVSTHYDNVADENIVHYQVAGLINETENLSYEYLAGNTELDGSYLQLLSDKIDYRLIKVNKGEKVPRDAIKIAAFLGLEKRIIDMAQNLFIKSSGI